MIISKSQYKEYIIPGAILRRTVNNSYGTHKHIFEVISKPYDYIIESLGTLKKFKYKSIDSGYKGGYFILDLFNGKVEVLNMEIFQCFFNEDEFQI